MRRKCLAVGIILLFIGTAVIPSSGQKIEKPSSTSRGNWLYVGGSGPGNYTRIQEAIDNASSGDTVYVYHGTYHEAILVDVETLSVIGEGRDVTCIDANSTSETVVISQSYVSLRGFTIIGKNYGVYVTNGLTAITVAENNLSVHYYGVEFEYDGDNNWNVLENNVFYSTFEGIHLVSMYDSGFNTIRNNTFVNNFHGIEIDGKQNRILNNTFLHCQYCGIGLYDGLSKIEGNVFFGNYIGLNDASSGDTITGNIFIGNVIGLDTDGSGNTITGNHFENNSLGVRLASSSTVVHQNNFIRNEKHATFTENSRSHGNTWTNNYWDASFHLFGYVFIFGKLKTGIKRFFQFVPDYIGYYWIRWINIDRNPAQAPYDIPGVRHGK